MIFRHLLNMRSHPTWVRGLKLLTGYAFQPRFLSHPTWVRGLKLNKVLKSRTIRIGRTLRGCVD